MRTSNITFFQCSSYLCGMTFVNKLLDIILSKIPLTMFISCKNKVLGFCLANSHKSRLYSLQLLTQNDIITNTEMNKVSYLHYVFLMYTKFQLHQWQGKGRHEEKYAMNPMGLEP
jgi:hypothetical protein